MSFCMSAYLAICLYPSGPYTKLWQLNVFLVRACVRACVRVCVCQFPSSIIFVFFNFFIVTMCASCGCHRKVNFESPVCVSSCPPICLCVLVCQSVCQSLTQRETMAKRLSVCLCVCHLLILPSAMSLPQNKIS